METIVQKEQISMSEEATKFILAISGSSARTMINYLEKIKILDRHIELDTAQTLCTDIPLEEFTKYISLCRAGNLGQAISVFYKLHYDGFSVMDIMNGLYSYLLLGSNSEVESEYIFKAIPLICEQIQVFMDVHEHPVELSFFTASLLKIFQ
jgi:DNA polymerase III gamma/tau subunit